DVYKRQGYNLEETISYLFISILGMISGFIACGFYALGKSNLAIVIEKCNVVSITISLFLVIVGWQENVIRMSVIIASIFVCFALFKLISTLSISNSSTDNIKNEYYNGKFFFYNSVNALCSYLFLFLDQWIISTTKESGLYLGVYFLAIQIINFLKYTQTQTSKLLLASITCVSDEYFRKITLVYMSITTLVILIVLPFKYIDLDLN
ncbi:hypothetical protein, partial [Vibrio sp. 99-70-13A1]|uniref:hypothetical protein n=1 Tax=Vibrio sp. 99-70-13A1 TaxID=2607601 RepID=UPI001C10A472